MHRPPRTRAREHAAGPQAQTDDKDDGSGRPVWDQIGSTLTPLPVRNLDRPRPRGLESPLPWEQQPLPEPPQPNSSQQYQPQNHADAADASATAGARVSTGPASTGPAPHSRVRLSKDESASTRSTADSSSPLQQGDESAASPAAAASLSKSTHSRAHTPSRMSTAELLQFVGRESYEPPPPRKLGSSVSAAELVDIGRLGTPYMNALREEHSMYRPGRSRRAGALPPTDEAIIRSNSRRALADVAGAALAAKYGRLTGATADDMRERVLSAKSRWRAVHRLHPTEPMLVQPHLACSPAGCCSPAARLPL